MTHHEHDPEMIECECRECDATFDLSRQHYYDNICPSCMKETDEASKWRTWPSCVVCDNRAPHEEMGSVTTHTRGVVGTETIPVCSKGCKGKLADVPPGPGGLPPIKKLDPGELPFFGPEAAVLNKKFAGED